MAQKLALVTGGTSGIGAAYASLLAASGHDLILTGRREDKLAAQCRQLVEEYDVHAEYRLGDLADPADRQALADLISALPGLDVLINNAGYACDGTYGDINWSDHQALLAVHVQATCQLSYAALPALLERRGRLVNVASVAAWLPTPQSALYGPTKAFVRSFSETLALSYRRQGLRVQALCPGFTVTDFHHKLGLDPASFYRSGGLMRAWSADFVARRSWRDLERNRIVSIPGWNTSGRYPAAPSADALLHWAMGRSSVARYGAD